MLEFLTAAEPADSAYHRLKQELAKDSTKESRERILCNMERLRWRDKKHAREADRYVFVNIASQQAWAVGPDSVINMRICCGKPATKTPLLSSEIYYPRFLHKSERLNMMILGKNRKMERKRN